jgi:hypothetical protein
MLTMTSLQKFPIKPLLCIIVTVVVMYIAVSIAGSAMLWRAKPKIEKYIGSYFNQKVLIGNINYNFPRTVIIRDVVFLTNKYDDAPELVSVRKIKLSLSAVESLKSGSISPIVFKVYSAKFQLESCAQFIEDNREKIIEFIKKLPIDQNFDFMIKKGVVVSDDQYVLAEIDNNFTVKNRKLISKGAVYFNNSRKTGLDFRAKDNAWKYVIKGLLSESDFSIDSVHVVNRDFQLKLWGQISERGLVLSGFSQVYNFLHYSDNVTGASVDELLEKAKNTEGFSQKGLTSDTIYIADIDCQVKFDWPRVTIKGISFSVENIPFSLSGVLFFEKTVSIDLKLASFADVENTRQRFNQRKFNLRLTGAVENKSFSGTLISNFYRKTFYQYKTERIKMVFDSLKVEAEKMRYLKFHVDSGEVFYTSNRNEYEFQLKDFQAFFDTSAERIKTFEFSSNIYDGFITGRGTVDVAFMPPRSGIDFIIIDASPKYFDSIVPFFSKVSGKLRCMGYYRNDPGTEVTGELVVENGELSDFQFFTWLSKSFKVPAIADIDFDSISSNFLMKEEGVKLTNISLSSQEVSMEGDFNLAHNDFVSGLLSLKIPRDVLVDSPRFKTLLRMLGEDFYHLGFEFQLSGLFDEMNFRWLDSRFKDNLQKAIPDFIERGMERKVERVIQQFYKTNPQ